MAEMTGDRARRGRSPRSSLRTGKPSTPTFDENGRRRAVDTICKQEKDLMSDAVNTGFILNMQRKLYRWSTANPTEAFADLFNIVCDRRTLAHAWKRLTRNAGSSTSGTDGVTRELIQKRSNGAAEFLEEIRQDLRQGAYQPQPVRQRLIPKPGKRRESSGHWASPRSRIGWSKWRSKWCWSRYSRRISIPSLMASGPVEAPMTHWREFNNACTLHPLVHHGPAMRSRATSRAASTPSITTC